MHNIRKLRVRALANIQTAIALCDETGETLAVCHLQFGADLLRESIESLDGTPSPSAGISVH